MSTFTRRRLLIAAVLAAGALPARCDPAGGDPAPAASAPSASAPAPSAQPSYPPVLSREARFVSGKEEPGEPGVFQTVITDKQLPSGETDPAEVTLVRIPGESKIGRASCRERVFSSV